VPVRFEGELGAVLSETETTVRLAVADFEASCWETAVTVTVAGFGTVAGAAYIPEEEMVPCAASPPETPFTCQLTPGLEALATEAVNCWVLVVTTEAEVGETVTVNVPGGGSVAELVVAEQP
jgi:hypothetical protein